MERDFVGEAWEDIKPHIEDSIRTGEFKVMKPLLQSYQIGETIDFTKERKGRVCNSQGDKVEQCPHCHRLGMRYQLIGGKIRYTHVGRKEEIILKSLDACYMWPRTEFKLQFGSDSIHPKFRRPGDEDTSVEELR